MSPSILLPLLLISFSVSSTIARRRFTPPPFDEQDPKYGTPLVLELLDEGLLHRSEVEGGYPTVTCVSRKMNEEPTIEECSIYHYTHGPVGCFAAWDNEGGKLQQGCLRAQDFSMQHQCHKKDCKRQKDLNNPHGMNFCCCFGDECNAVYYN